MSAEPKPDLRLEIGHLLLIDVVGYSKLLINDQIELLQELKQIVRRTECFRAAEEAGKLIRVPTGDGMALVFFRSPEEPVQCALEIAHALKASPHIQLRMGIHSGPVNQVTDVNERVNVAGAGINVAQRVMACGDAGHILLSKHVADDLAQYASWRPYLHDLGEYEVKHGLRLHLVNLYKEVVGNPARPSSLGRTWTSPAARAVRWWKWTALLGLIAAILILAWAMTRSRHPATPQNRIAVLPFENLSDEPGTAYFTDGVQDEILTKCSKVADLQVISRTSVLSYRGREPNVTEIVKQLGVTHILEGTVQRSGARVRVSAQLIDARTDTHIWAEHYDRDIADVFALESELAQTIVNQLKVKLAAEEKAAIEQSPTSNQGAFDLYAHARTLLASSTFTRGKENRFEAVHFLEQAIALDRDFFAAYCQLARVHDEIYLLGMDHTPARIDRAEAALADAKRLRPNAPELHLAQAYHRYCGYLDYSGASQELDIAKRALPNDPLVFELAGYIDRRQGRWEDSARNLGRALELDPRNFDFLQQVAASYGKLRDYARQAATLDQALTIMPNDPGVREKRATVDLEWRANTKPLRAVINAIVAESPSLAVSLADDSVDLALCERDFGAAEQAFAVMPPQGAGLEGFSFPKAWYQGLIARCRGDATTAKAAFTRARSEVEETVRQQPDYAEAVCLLGLIDAGLGNKETAIQEGERAAALLPVAKDAINGALVIEYLAIIYAWTGENSRALEQLTVVTSIPSEVSYGELKLHPVWDLLRGDARFEKLLAAMAPK